MSKRKQLTVGLLFCAFMVLAFAVVITESMIVAYAFVADAGLIEGFIIGGWSDR